MTDILRQEALKQLEQMKKEEASRKQYILDKSNAILADLLQDYATHGELTKFEITPLEMSGEQLRNKYLKYMENNR